MTVCLQTVYKGYMLVILGKVWEGYMTDIFREGT